MSPCESDVTVCGYLKDFYLVRPRNVMATCAKPKGHRSPWHEDAEKTVQWRDPKP
jgi:hypothetical protein